MLQVGDEVPEFQLEAGTGETVDSRKLRGQRWVIYFYPKDNTSGCTIETREFGLAQEALRARGVLTYGCSVGDVATKKSFAASCGAASLPLLADPDHRVAEQFGVWQQRKFAGREYMGIVRTTFLIGPGGQVERVWEDVKPEGHAQDVVAATAA
jgi:peroxiredoxin Q/BCP